MHCFDKAKLRYHRTRKGLTQMELARQCGEKITNADINKYETGRIAKPAIERLEIIAHALGLRLEDLMTDPEEEKKADTPQRRALAAMLDLTDEERKAVLNALDLILSLGMNKPKDTK